MTMFKSGGGYLKGITATILGITFDAKDWPAKKKGGEGYSTLSARLAFKTEGATEEAFTFLPAGFFYPDNQAISEDGVSLQSDREGPIIQGDSEFAKFVNSIDALDASVFEGCDGHNFDACKGLRVTFDRVLDVEGTAKFGKRKDKKDPTREYNRDWLIVSAVHGFTASSPTTTKAATGSAPVGRKLATNGSGKALKPTPPAPAARTAQAPAVASVDTDAVDTALLNILADAKGSVDRKMMGSKATRYRLKHNLSEEDGEALRSTLMSDAYLADAVARELIDLTGSTITAL